jgi:transcription elongation factor GreA
MTDAIKRKLQEEINALEHELIHELPKEIKKAAALGDLQRENAEYHAGKQRQEFVKARVRQLGKRLADLSMVNMANIPHDKVGLGSTVKVFDNTKNEESAVQTGDQRRIRRGDRKNFDHLADRPRSSIRR